MINQVTIQQIMNPLQQGGIQGAVAAQGEAGFAAVLEQLLGGGEMDFSALLEGLGQPGAIDTKEGEEKGSLLAAEMLAGLLMQDIRSGPQFTALLEGGSQEVAALTAALPQSSALPEEKPFTEETQAPTQDFAAQLQKSTGRAEPQAAEMFSSSRQALSSLEGQSRFRSAVLEAERLLANGEKDGKKEEPAVPDIDLLQTQVDRTRLHQSAPLEGPEAPREPELDRADLAQQMRASITQNLGKGESEFVVRLKPQGLGEITVKMVEKDSKITLSIVTGSSQTAKLLGGEIDALKQALLPHQVEVREVTVASSQQSPSANQSDLFGQFLGGQQGRQPHHSSQGSPHNTPSGNLAQEEPFTDSLSEPLTSGLDTYM